MTAKIAIIIAARDAEPWVGETLSSVLAQTHADWQCRVVDDGSTDGTAEVVERYCGEDSRISLVRVAGVGVSAARNVGLGLVPADAHYVAVLDSDDTWLPTALAQLVAALEQRPDAVGVTGLAETMDQHGRPVEVGRHAAKLRGRLTARRGRLRVVATGEDTTFDVLATAGRVWPPAVALLRAEAVRTAGGFDEVLRSSEDWDLLLRVARQGPLVFLDEQVAWYRQHRGSVTAGDPVKATYFCDAVRRKAFVSAQNTRRHRRAVVAGWRAVQLAALADALRRAMRGHVSGSGRSRADVLREVRALGVTSFGPGPPVPDLSWSHHRSAMVSVVQPSARAHTSRSATSWGGPMISTPGTVASAPAAAGAPWASAIVRSCDSALTLGATIESLRCQDVPVEVIVVDSGSSDGTVALAQQMADVLIHTPRETFSYGGALNTGAAAATTGVHVALSSHCTLPRTDWVRIAVGHVRQGAAAVCGLPRDGEGNQLVEPFAADHAYVLAHPHWGFTNHASAWAATAWATHRFDEELRATEDKEWTWRALHDSGPLVVDPHLFVHGHHRRAAGARRYYRRLVAEMAAIEHLRPLPAFSARDAVMTWAAAEPTDPAMSQARRLGRTRLVEVAARWRVGGCRLVRTPAGSSA